MSELRWLKKMAATAAPLLILAVPSLWLIAAVPLLFHDVDGYVETVFPLYANTILLHGPLYCILSRVPLWLGYLTSGAGLAVRLSHFIKHTQLTDSGVFALVFAQHVALWWAALFFINIITTNLWSRLLLAIFFASHPLFYVFAQLRRLGNAEHDHYRVLGRDWFANRLAVSQHRAAGLDF